MLRRRLVLKLLQRQVADQIGVNRASIANWESNRTEPGIEYMPAIIRFLGYNPLPQKEDWASRLVQCRTILGLTQKEAAHRIGVDPSTLAKWERGEREPTGDYAARAERFLATVEVVSALTSARLA
jgi:transcriptional regulator with XRE-family HTH domain